MEGGTGRVGAKEGDRDKEREVICVFAARERSDVCLQLEREVICVFAVLNKEPRRGESSLTCAHHASFLTGDAPLLIP